MAQVIAHLATPSRQLGNASVIVTCGDGIGVIFARDVAESILGRQPDPHLQLIQRQTRAICSETLLKTFGEPTLAGAASAHDRNVNGSLFHTTAFSRDSAITS